MISKPKYYITTKWETREGFRYKQPFEYCNKIKLTFESIDNFKKIFNVDFSNALKESTSYNNSLIDCNYNSKLWKNDYIKNKAFEVIYNFNVNGKSGSGSSTTALLPFEIFMMNDGFEMISFCELNAINPGIQIIADKFINGGYINPKGLVYNRCYKKDDNFIYVAFGIEVNKKKTKFYFKSTNNHYTFQIDNNIQNYKKAIGGELNPLDLVLE